jgi:chromosome segregation ATPase
MVTAEMAQAAPVEQMLRAAREGMQRLEFELEKLPEQLRAAVGSDNPDPAQIVSLRRRREELGAQIYVARLQCKRLEVRVAQAEISRHAGEVEQHHEAFTAKSVEVEAARQVFAERQAELSELGFMRGRAQMAVQLGRDHLTALERELSALITEAAQG